MTKRTNLLVMLLTVMVGILAFGEQASAYYHTGLGRFMSRDPIGEAVNISSAPNRNVTAFAPMDSLGQGDLLTEQAQNNASRKMGRMLGAANSTQNHLWKYADGLNVYGYVSANPVRATDPSGMDRYVDSDAYLHYFLVVDNWTLGKNAAGCACWKKSGQTRYDFRMAYTDLWLEMQIVNAVGAITFSSAGEVSASPYTGTPMTTIVSTPEADQALQTQLDMMVADPPNYHAMFYNCNWWTNKWKYHGIQETAGKKGLPTCP